MKVTFLKAHKMGSNSFDKGDNAVIITSVAEELIKDGVCEENNSVTLREKIVESKAEDNKEESTQENEQGSEEPKKKKK